MKRINQPDIYEGFPTGENIYRASTKTRSNCEAGTHAWVGWWPDEKCSHCGMFMGTFLGLKRVND